MGTEAGTRGIPSRATGIDLTVSSPDFLHQRFWGAESYPATDPEGPQRQEQVHLPDGTLTGSAAGSGFSRSAPHGTVRLRDV